MNLEEIKQSGLLELYALGELGEEQHGFVSDAIGNSPELKQVVSHIQMSLEVDAFAHEVAPHKTVKPFLMATLDYIDRLSAGEQVDSPPILTEKSSLEEYKKWLDNPKMNSLEPTENISARIIAHEPSKITAIVWLRESAPTEVHEDELERFLIAEGRCMITIGEEGHYLGPGDYMEMPLHVAHHVKVISEVPCKILLQRVFVS